MGAKLPQNKVKLNIGYPKGTKIDCSSSYNCSVREILSGALSVVELDREHGTIMINNCVPVGTSILLILSGTKPPALRELMRALRSKAAFWEDIGVELLIDDGDLVQISSDNVMDSRSRLRAMLRKWLARVNPRPTWTAVIEALEQLGDEELAGRLKSKYCTSP